MTNDTMRERILEQQELVRRDLTLEEVVDMFDGELSSDEVQEALTQMNADGYLFFDGDTVIVFR